MGGVISRRKEAVQLPEDVTVEILKSLPVKSLIRFRSLCKTWYAVISDSEFCNKFHPKGACLLICSRLKGFSTVTVKSFLMNGKTLIRSTPLSLPWQPEPEPKSCSKFLGSCNGLVCFYHMSGLILWNPSTRKFKKLPSTSQCFVAANTCAGFGYDESVDDYKFVWMVCKNGLPSRKRIETDVFSLKSNTWRRMYHHYPSSDISLSRIKFGQNLTGVFSNGAIHWVIRYSDPSSNSFRILAFDLASGSYRLLHTPQLRGNVNSIYVVSLSGCLCLCIHYIFQGSRIELWRMKEYGVDSSWLKLMSFPTTLSILTFYPILFSYEDGKVVAIVKYITWSGRHSEVCEIMRLQFEKGAVVKAETLLCDVSTSVLDDYAVLNMEETSVSLD